MVNDQRVPFGETYGSDDQFIDYFGGLSIFHGDSPQTFKYCRVYPHIAIFTWKTMIWGISFLRKILRFMLSIFLTGFKHDFVKLILLILLWDLYGYSGAPNLYETWHPNFSAPMSGERGHWTNDTPGDRGSMVSPRSKGWKICVSMEDD